jgi:hypothetical protein
MSRPIDRRTAGKRLFASAAWAKFARDIGYRRGGA